MAKNKQAGGSYEYTPNDELNDDENKENSDYIKKNLFYAVVVVLVIILIVALALSIFSLFNSGSQGAQGPPGPQGIQGLQGPEGSPCSCSCSLPTNGTTIIDNYSNNGVNRQGRIAAGTGARFGNMNGNMNGGANGGASGSVCSRLKNFISGLSQDDINLVLNSTSNNALVNSFKNAIISYQNTGTTTGCANLNIEQLQTWLTENGVQPDFYDSVLNDNINLSAIDLNDKNMNYFISILNKNPQYSSLPKNKFVTLSDSEKILILRRLLGNAIYTGNNKVKKIILREIRRLSRQGNVNL